MYTYKGTPCTILSYRRESATIQVGVNIVRVKPSEIRSMR